MTHRIRWIDSQKGVGIILVLFGHFIEPFRGKSPVFDIVFVVIYSFHMPLFCVLSGLVAKKNVKKTAIYWTWIYFVYQLLYLFLIKIHYLNYNIMNNRFFDSFIMPFWHMWYLYAFILWNLSLYLIDGIKNRINKYILVAISIVVAILTGFVVLDKGYGMQRVATFYPLFLVGYLFRDGFFKPFPIRIKVMFGTTFLAIIVVISLFHNFINSQALFNNKSYEMGEYNWYGRLMFIIISISLSVCLIIILNGCRNHYFEAIGVRSLYIFLNHGFIFWFLRQNGYFSAIIDLKSPVIAIVIALVALGTSIFFSNKPIISVFEFIYMIPRRMEETLVNHRFWRNSE